MQDLNAAEVARISLLLKTAIQTAGLSARHVERRLGIGSGFLSRLFAGRIKLRFTHVYDISSVIGLDPVEFWQIAFPPRKDLRSPTARKLLDLVSRTRMPAPAPAAPPPQVSSQQIEEMIRTSVRQVFADLARPPQ